MSGARLGEGCFVLSSKKCMGEGIQWPPQQAAFLLFSLVPLDFNLTSLNSHQINILARLRAC